MGLAGFVLLFLFFTFFVRPHLPSTHPRDLKNLLLHSGGEALFLFLAFYAFRYFFLLPMTLLTVLSGMVWGAWLGGLYSTIGATLNGLFLFFLVKIFGQKPFDFFLKKEESVDLVLRFVRKKAWGSLLFLRFVPVLGFEGPTILAAVAEVSAPTYTATTFLGVSPFLFFYARAGSTIHDFSLRDLGGAGVFIAALFVSSILLILFLRKPLFKKLAQWDARSEQESP